MSFISTIIQGDPFAIILTTLLMCLVLEHFFPNRLLKTKKKRLVITIIFNIIQLLVVIVMDIFWSYTFNGVSIFNMKANTFSPIFNAFIAYIINTWIFYWWHLVRHENDFLWLTMHQFHHSPSTLNVLTSFYKHPIEMVLNSLIIGLTVGPILGLDLQTIGWLTIFSAFGEFFYHINIKTPYWLGFIIQRPESHNVHHAQNRKHVYNHADLPIWDILGGTFLNPKEDVTKMGFSEDREDKVKEMLMFKNVLPERNIKAFKGKKNIIILVLIFIGFSNMIGYTLDIPIFRTIGVISTASPLPLVFSSYNGVETFSTEIVIKLDFGTKIESMIMDSGAYSKLQGPYNRKNVIGAIFSHGPFFNTDNLVKLKEQVLDWGFCRGFLVREFGYEDRVERFEVMTKSKVTGDSWLFKYDCGKSL
jgi:sterol desaturase/sphingolipid hydroxylase (fatty acid hydroxylase superfamily)